MPDHLVKKISLDQIARKAMAENGLEADFSKEALAQLNLIQGPAEDSSLPDLTGLLWCSIDNDDSRDLDQLSVAEKLPGDKTRVYVAVADVDSRVPQGTPLDLHAQKNTTSVYTGVETFPMLPEKLSTDLTSLSFNETRVAVIVDMRVNAKGEVEDAKIYRARVKNWAKLAYNGVGAWLEGKGPCRRPRPKFPAWTPN